MGDRIEAGRDAYKVDRGGTINQRTNAAELEAERIRKIGEKLDTLEKRSGHVAMGPFQFRQSRNHFAEQIANAFYCELEKAQRIAERMLVDGPIAPEAERDAWRSRFYDALNELSGGG